MREAAGGAASRDLAVVHADLPISASSAGGAAGHAPTRDGSPKGGAPRAAAKKGGAGAAAAARPGSAPPAKPRIAAS